MFKTKTTLYDVLDLTPECTPQEIRESYFRIKLMFKNDSVVLYGVFAPDEREEALKKIEEAYHILSDHEKREAYDSSHHIKEELDPNYPLPQSVNNIDGPKAKIIVLDRSLLPQASTSQHTQADTPQANSGKPPSPALEEVGKDAQASSFTRPLTHSLQENPSQRSTSRLPHSPSLNSPLSGSSAPSSAASASSTTLSTLPSPPDELTENEETEAQEAASHFALEAEGSGAFLKKVREALKISVEEMTSITKISKTYLLAIEEENYERLPAAVYIRGFVIQIAKTLKIPHEKVAIEYIHRYHLAQKKIRS